MAKEYFKRDYYYTFLCDLLEMASGTFAVIHSDKTLNKLYTAVIDYLYSKLPDCGGLITDFDVLITVEKT